MEKNYSKHEAKGAPVKKNGGNKDAIHTGKACTGPKKMMGK